MRGNKGFKKRRGTDMKKNIRERRKTYCKYEEKVKSKRVEGKELKRKGE